MRGRTALDGGVDFGPYKLGSNVSWGIKLSVDVGPEVGQEEFVVNFEGHEVFLLFGSQFLGQFLLIFICPELDLSHVLMLKLLFIWVIDFLFNLVNDFLVDFLFIIFSSLIFVVVLDHHHTFPFIVPGCLDWVLFEDFVALLASDEKGLFQSTIQHHDVALDCKKARVILFCQVLQWVILLKFLLEFLFCLIEVFLVFVKFFVLNILFQLNTLELLVHFWFFFDDFLWFYPFQCLRKFRAFIFNFLKFIFLLFRFFFSFLNRRRLIFYPWAIIFILFLFDRLLLLSSSFLFDFFLLLLQFFFNVISQLFVVSLDLICQNRWCCQENAMKADRLVDVIWAASCVGNFRWKLFLVKRKSDLEQHFDWKQSQDCTSCFTSSTSANHHDITILSNDIFLLISQLDFEIGNFGQQFNQRFGTLEIDKSFDHFLIDFSLILIEFFPFNSIQMILGNPPFHSFIKHKGWGLCTGNIVNLKSDRWEIPRLSRLHIESGLKDLSHCVIRVDFFIEKVIKLKILKIFADFNLQFLAVVSLCDIFLDPLKCELDSFIEFLGILDDWVSQNVYKINVTLELISLNRLTSADHRRLFNSDMNQKVFLSESLDCKKSVEGEGFSFDSPCIAELTTSMGFLKKLSIGQHHDNGQNVFHLIKVAFCKLGHKFGIEPDLPFEFTEDVVWLVKNFNILNSFQIGVKIFD